MEIQNRKLLLIEEVLHINDVGLIGRLESIIRSEKEITGHKTPSPMSNEEFCAMIDKGIDDVHTGRVQSHTSLKKEVQSWK